MQLLAEFDDPDRLLEAVRAMRTIGYETLETYTPYPVPGLEEALAIPRSRIPVFAFVAGGLAGATGYFVQYLMNGVLYPLNVGSRPLHSAPANVPITFESTVLFASLTAFVALLVKCRLPSVWYPLFEVEGFERATVDRFFLTIAAHDVRFDPARGRRELEDLGAIRVVLVEVEP
jgi:hypothetical protein